VADKVPTVEHGFGFLFVKEHATDDVALDGDGSSVSLSTTVTS
jgi:hypothetical protein